MNNYTIQNYKKNETIYCEGETPTHLMCLLSGKVKIYKDGVGGRSQIIRMIKPREYFGTALTLQKQTMSRQQLLSNLLLYLSNSYDCLHHSGHTKQRPCHVLYQPISVDLGIPTNVP